MNVNNNIDIDRGDIKPCHLIFLAKTMFYSQFRGNLITEYFISTTYWIAGPSRFIIVNYAA